MIPDADVHRDELRRRIEARKLVAGGRTIWPVRRSDMIHAATIRERMAEDLAKVENRAAGQIFLLALGWTEAQLADHGADALAVRFGAPDSDDSEDRQ